MPTPIFRLGVLETRLLVSRCYFQSLGLSLELQNQELVWVLMLSVLAFKTIMYSQYAADNISRLRVLQR